MKSKLPWLCSLALTLCLSQLASAQDVDFNVIEMPEASGISFDVIAKTEQQLATEDISFAVLDCSKCDCETTGVCLCEDCQCPNCPKKDKRPVITVKTTPNCVPCAKCKKDSKDLTEFRWLFIEQDEVEDGAPRLEWQGLDSRWALNGWHGIENFKEQYERSQRPAVAKLDITRPVYRTPAPRYYSVPSYSSCSGGRCRNYSMPRYSGPSMFQSFAPAYRGSCSSCSGGMCR